MTKQAEAKKAPTTRAPKAPEVKAGPRGGRIAPLQDQVVAALKKGSVTVAAMAEKFKVPERDVRLAIDRARVKGWDIQRVAKGTFGIPAGSK